MEEMFRARCGERDKELPGPLQAGHIPKISWKLSVLSPFDFYGDFIT